MTIRLKLLAGFTIPIVIFMVDFFVNQRLSEQVNRNTSYISISETIIRNSNLLHKRMIDMQSGYRGYLLTGQESFLETYYDGTKSVPPLLREQYTLVSSLQQMQRLSHIQALHNSWVRYASSLIEARRSSTLPHASAEYQRLFENKLKMEVGKKLNDEIRDTFQDFDNYEYSIRQQRRAALQHSIIQTREISLTLTLISIAIAIASSFYIIRIITGRISKMVNLADDISKGNFKLIEDHRTDELQQLSESLNTMSMTLDKNFKELTKKNKELDQFAYVVSHDLKAPLRGIDNLITWMEEDHASDLAPAVKKNIDLIKGRTRRLENMINGLLEYARIGKIKKVEEIVNVGALLKDLADLLVPENFDISIERNMPLMLTNRSQIEQVFANLISNAVKYNNKAQGSIHIGCRDLGYQYEFSVSDNGIGIQPQYFEKIFTIFQTLQERDAFESTGVGLAIVKKIIEDQKANITVHSVPGQGAEFRFTWPKTGAIKQEKTNELLRNYV